MPRLPAHIREAVPSDARALLDLWSQVGRGRDVSPRALEDAERALASLAADPDERMLVAEADDQIVGALQLTRGPISPLVLDTVVHTSFLLVHPAYRKHGHGHALMEAAVTWAEEKDVHQITAITDASRETNRFFARLGLVTLANVRHASTAALRKKLAAERGGRGAGNRHLVEVMAQRRTMRRRQRER